MLQALRKQRKWQLMLALGKLLEARHDGGAGRGARRTAEADGAWGAWRTTTSGTTSAAATARRRRWRTSSATTRELTPVEAPAARAPVETVHYNVMIAACAPPRKWKEAVELFDRMKASSVARATCARNSVPRNSGARNSGRAIFTAS